MEPHTEKRSAPFVATQIYPHAISVRKQSLHFYQSKNARFWLGEYKFVWQDYGITPVPKIQGKYAFSLSFWYAILTENPPQEGDCMEEKESWGLTEEEIKQRLRQQNQENSKRGPTRGGRSSGQGVKRFCWIVQIKIVSWT